MGQVPLPHRPGQIVDATGALVGDALAWVGGVSAFGARAVREAFRPPFEVGETLRQLHEIGWRSVPLVAAAGLAIGVVLSMHTRDSLERFGAESRIPAGLALALVRETGPLLAALLVAGRVGAGIGAELGAMNVTEQIDALEAGAVDSFKYLAVTRIVACVIALPLLTAIVDFSGMFGGFLAEHAVSGIDFGLYFHRSFELMAFDDFVPATLKTAVFGLVIGTVASYLGFTTREGTAGVGRASTRSVVLASISIILINVILVKFIFTVYPGQP